MSKTTTILLVLGVALFVGIGVYFQITPQMILDTMSHPETLIPKITTFLEGTWQYILTGGLSVIGAIIMFADKIRGWRQTVETTKEQASELLTSQKVTLETQISDLNAQIQTQQQQFGDTVGKLSEQVTTSQEQAIQATESLKQMTAERDYLVQKKKELEAQIKLLERPPVA